MDPVPDLVTMHLWTVPDRQVPMALLRMAGDRGLLGRTVGLRFAKLLGTGDGRTFTVRDADRNRWGLLATWDKAADITAFEAGPVARGWGRIADERLRVDLRPLTSRGQWSGREPFGTPDPDRAYDGPVAALTRARIRVRRMVTFWRAVPPVAADLHGAAGLRLAVGVGEAPIGLQGTFSLWDSPAAVTEFAYRRPAHLEAVRRTAEVGWYSEELFARFAVLAIDGTVGGRTP